MKPFLFLILLIMGGELCAQNLLLNPSFEDSKSCNPLTDEAYLEDAAPWYVVGPTPDLVEFNCANFTPTNTPIFINENTPLTGDAFVHIAGAATLGGAFFTEAVGVRLAEPLEAGRIYYLDAWLRVRGFRGESAGYCANEKHQFAVHASQDSIILTSEYDGLVLRNTTMNAELVLADTANWLLPGNAESFADPVPWQALRNCFQASGGEEHLAFSHNVGLLTTKGLCEIDTTELGIFYAHSYDIDDVSLEALPLRYAITDTICQDEPNQVELLDYVDLPVFNPIEFVWSDGFVGTAREIEQAGAYEIDIHLPCGNIPFDLELVPFDCDNDVYVPNTFSPNFDGVNDGFRPFIQDNLPVIAYQLSIYDRWGGLVFESTDPMSEWDGMREGQRAGIGLYAWQLQYSIESVDGVRSFIEVGDVFLVR